jgi:hypothetical protein
MKNHTIPISDRTIGISHQAGDEGGSGIAIFTVAESVCPATFDIV